MTTGDCMLTIALLSVISAKTFGWDASKEEWDSIYSHT